MSSLQARTIGWWIIKIIFYPLIFILGPVKIYGKPKSDKKKPYIIICNHPSLFDPILLFLFAPIPIIFLGAEEVLKSKGVNVLSRFFKAIPVVRGSASSARKALLQAIEELKKGEIVALFPEGETSIDPHIRRFNKGFLYIAKKANVPIQCVILKNSSRIIPYGKFLPRPSFKSIKFFWGKQFCVSNYSDDELLLKDIQAHFYQVFTKEKITES